MKSSCTTKTLNNHIVAPRTIHKSHFGLLPGRTVILTSRCPSMPLMRFFVAALFVLLCITSAFLAPPAYADHDDSTAGICARTAAVHNEIVRQIRGVTDCARVTTAQLAAIEFLNLFSKGITTLKAGDFAGLSALTNLDLRYNLQLSTLPAGIFSGLSALTRLDLNNNQISTLPAGIFSGLSALTRLDLNNNQISTLPAGIFSGLSALTNLDLSSNQISTLPASAFTSLSALTRLDLSNNQLSTLPAGAFTGLSKLTELSLSNNQLSTLPAGAFTGLSKLTELSLINNQLSTLPADAFSGLSALTRLDLNNNQISTLPAGIFSGLSALTRLDLSSNQISTLPASAFTSLSALTRLDLSNNQLSTLPAGIFSGLSALTQLDLHNNQLSTLPAGIFSGLSALTELDLVGNPLDASAIMLLAGLPATITVITNASGGICTRTKAVRNEIVRNIAGVTDCARVTTEQLAAITFLGLGRKGITALKAGDFAGLSALTQLHLYNNQISTLPAGIFSGLSALTQLHLYNNQISTLPAGIFSGLSALTQLHLYNNQISTLPAGIFSGLSALTQLHLGNNQISTLPAGIFSGLSALTVLYLFDNQITTLPAGIFSDLSALTELNLYSNPLNASAITLLADLPATVVINFSPVAEAGQPQSVARGTVVTLDGSASVCFRGCNLYAWTQTAGTPTVTLSNANAARPTFTVSDQLPANAVLTFSLVVNDGFTNSQPDTVMITVNDARIALAKISTYAADASNPIPTLMDYTDAGVMDVSADNLEAVNMAVAAAASTAADADTLVKIQALAAPAIMTAAAKMAALAKISTYAADASNPIPTLMDYTDAGVMDVSADNLEAVNMAVAAAASTAAEADTLVKIQALATPAIMTAAAKMAALAKISTYAGDSSNPAPTLMDYTDAGVIGVSADNLEAVNAAVAAAATAADADTLADIQSLAAPAIMTAAAKAAALAKISTYAGDDSNPAPTLMDYTDAGVVDVSADNLEAVNAAVAAASTAADADTLADIQSLAAPAIMTAAAKATALAKISTYAGDSSSPAPTLMDYTDAGVMGVSADNLEAVNAAVAAASTAADADTLADIQSLAAPAIMTAAANMAALAKISTYAGDSSSPAPTLMDYTDAGIMDVSADNLEAVNAAVAAAASTAAEADTLDDIQSLATPAIMTAAAKATALAKISTYAGDSSNPAPTLMDYTDAGVMGVSADNLEAVNAAVAAASTAAEADTLADIQSLAAPAIMTAAANMAALDKISTYAGDSSSPAPTLMDYTDAGVMGVSADNLEAVNAAVAAASTAAESDTLVKIQALVNPAITNDAPTADAGAAQTVAEGAMVTLDGSTSSDPEMQTLAYAWTQTTGVDVTLTGANTASPTFTAPANLVTDATLTFSLVVNDGFTNSQPDTVTITVTAGINDAPTANAGPDQTVAEGAMVTLDGSASSDPEMQTLAYAWTQTTGVDVTLTGANTASPTFTAPDQITADATLTFSLMVNDGNMDSPADTVTITVTAGTNDAPTANAGSPQTVGEFETVALSGSGTDPEGEDLTYAWTQTSGRTVIALTGADTASPTFTAPRGQVTQRIRGRFRHGFTRRVIRELRFTRLIFILTVTDARGAIGTSRVGIDVHGRNDAPTANAGPDQTVAEGAMVTLDGSASSDPEMQTLAYTWTQTAGVDVTLSDATAASPTFTAPDNLAADATLTFSLSVRDAQGLVSAFRSTVEITVTAGINDAPTANAGAAQTVAEGAMVTLDGSASSDPEMQTLAYAWTQTTGVDVTLTGANTASPTFTAPDQITADAVLTFSLVVNDGNMDSQPDTVTITVTAGINDAPTADAGAAQTVAEGAMVALDGSASSDPENETLTYTWTQTAGTPAVTLTGANTASPTFTAPDQITADAVLTFSLVVNDGNMDSQPDTVIITAKAGICARTVAVRDAILARIGVTNCTLVTTAQLTTIEFLNFYSRGITTLKAGDFAGLSKLPTLDLRFNQLSTLPAGAFTGLSALTFLGLNDNQLSTLPAGAFSGLSALTGLGLSDNQLSTLPAGIFSGLSALTRLDLVGNPLDASAIMLLAGLPATITVITNASGGICARTEAVRNAIVARIAGVTDCAMVTTAQLTTIEFLNFYSRGITTLKAGDFAGLSALTTLYLNNNQISTLPAGAFTGLSALTELRLENNQISTLSAGAFTGLSALTELRLENNQLSTLPAGAFTGLSALTELRLENNQISTLSAGAFSGLSALTELDLHNNQLSTLPAGAFSGLSALTELDLHNNQLSTLPAGAFSGLSALTELDLHNNQLSTLPAGAFSGLSALTELDLVGNPLDASAIMLLAGLPATITVITNASGGICTRTKAIRNEIVASIAGVTDCALVTTEQLAAITFMSLSGRGITTLKAGDFAGLSALTTLWLEGNPISTLPAGIFSGLSALIQLRLNGNPISTLPAGIFSGLSALTTLYLNGNQISTLPAGIFSGLSALTGLYLNNNQLSALPAGAFTSLSALTTLSLINNQISTLPAGIFSGLSALTRLELAENQLSTLPAGIFSDLSALTHLLLFGNQLDASAITLLAGLPATVFVDVQPVAEAGQPQSVTRGTVVTLDGSASVCFGGCSLTYAWAQTAGTPMVSLNGETTAMPTFTVSEQAPANAVLTFSLVVRSGFRYSLPDTVTITVNAAKATALAKISTYAGDSSNPAPTLMDYTDAGVMQVSADNLEAVNMAVAAAATAAEADTLADIQALAAPAIMTAAAKMAALAKISTYAGDASSPAPTLMDYTDAGVMQVSADNLEAVNMAVAAASTAAEADTTAKIQALATPAIMTAAAKTAALAKISTYAADASNPAPTLMDYTDAGVMDVSADNLEAVNAAVAAAATADDADTLADIQALAAPAIMTAAAKMAALAKISAYAADDSNPIPTLMDYTDAGVMQVSADNLEAVNMAVAAAATAAEADTLADIQALAAPAIMTAAAKMAALAKISTYAGDASSPAPTLMDYTDAGVMGVSADNLEAVNAAVAAASTAADADTLADIQSLAAPAIMTAAANMAALAKISTYAGDSSNPAPTLMDYTDAGVMGVSADNLEAVNAAVAAASTAAEADTLADIQSLAAPAIMTAAAKATALAKISTYAGDSSNPAPTLMDYTDAGVMGVSADNLEAVNMAVAAASTAADADTLADIQSLAAPAIMTAAANMAALSKISTYAGDSSNPAPTLMDYTDAGVMGVSADNLEAVNAAVAAASTAADADTLADIQSLAAPAIMTAAANMAALAKISTYAGDSSNPAPTLMDYTDAGVMGVSADNLEAVNAAVAAASTAADADTLADIQSLAAPAIMTAAAKATALAKISTYAADSSNPAPTLMDYTDAGVMGVSADNLEAVNAAVAAASTAADADTLADIQSLAAPAIMTAAAKATALAKISTYAGDSSNPVPTLMDYTDAGVMGVSADNLEAVNAAVAAAATAAEADTLADIQSLAAPAIMTAAAKATALAKISTYAGDSSNPAPTLMDYTDAGVMGVSADNLEAVNAAVAAASTAADADTLADIQSLAAPAIMTAAANMAALAKISTYAGDSSSPAPTLMDYTDAGVMDVSADNLEAVNAAVAAAATAAEADTLADIQSLAAPAIMTAAAKATALAKISTYAGDSSNPAPTLMDYTDAGVMGVSADNLEAVNAAVAAASTAAEADTLADIQSLAAPAIMTAAANMAALAKISTYAGDSSSPAPTLMDYTDAGVMGVSADNLEAVNAAVAAASTAADADTLADIQSLAAPAIMTAAANMAALAKISTYAADSSNPAPTLMDYTDAGVMGVSADNLEAVNAAVAAASTAADADTLADIQSLAAPAIMTAAAKATALAKISTYAADSSNPAPTLMDYTDAGVMGVSADNLEAVNAAVAAASTAADADTLADIQSLAAPAIMTAAAKATALAKISTYAGDSSNPVPTLMDYTDAGVMGVSADNLEAVNAAVAAAATAAEADTLADIQSLAAPAIMTAAAKATALAKISTYAGDSSNPAPTLMDYTDAGVMGVSADNLEAVNAAVAAASTAADADTLADIQSLAAPAIMTAAANMAALAKISTYAGDSSSPAPTLMDYTDAGVMDVSADNLEAVNAAVAAAATAAEADTLADIQSLAAPAIMTAAAKATALAKISTYAGDSSNPAPTLMDYTDAGVMGVSADNLEAVNAAVAAASTAAEADTLADIQSLAAPAIMTAAANMAALAKISTYAGDSSSPAPTLMDYTDAGVMGVSADNLEAVNAAVAAASTAADADTLADIQSLAAPAIMTAAANMAALAKISTYAADSSNPAPTLMDYTDAGVMGVSADNLEAVNAAVAAASTAADADTLADIQSLAAPAIMTAAAKATALAKISTYAADSSNPAPTLMDYTDAGVMGVSADNLEAVNAAVAAASTAADADTLADIQSLAAPAIMTAAANMAALAKISTYAGDSSNPAPTLMDYTDAGVMGVSADNLEAVNAAVAAASTAAEADTLADIQSLAAPAIMTVAAKATALAKISTYAGDSSNPAPTLMDYTDAGVMDVSADNLEAVNAAVAAASTAADADTLADIQSLAAPAIMTAAANMAALAKISTYAGDSSSPAPTLMDYTDAGVMGVSADNLEAVNAAVAAASTAADADTLADIQSLAAPAIMTAAANMAALAKISTYAGDSSNPAPTLMDYTDAGVMGVSADNLEAVNAAVAAASTAADADTLADIQSLAAPAIMTAAAKATALAKISTYAGDSSNLAPTLMDYTDAGVMQVSADNLEAVNMAVAAAATAAEADTLADIQALAAPAIMTAAAKMAALAKISTYAGDSSSPAPTLMDYTDAGVMGVSADNLEAVNAAVAAASTAADADTLADIQSLAAPAIMTAAAKATALAKISTYAGDSSNPAPTLMDYTDAGVMGVSADNLEAVNAAVAAASTAADADTLADIQSLAAPAIMTAAANMAALAKISTYAGDSSNPAPTLMDYTDAGVMGVSADNLEAVNAAVAAASTAAEADTLADIQSLAAPAIMTAAAKMAALDKISTYAGDSSNPAPTLMDYTDAGVMGVSADNLEAVNAAVATASTAADADTLADIQSLAAPAIMTAAANMAALAKISTYAGDSSNPAPTLMDYTDAGVMGVSADNLEAINAAVAAASTAADADTLADIQALAAPAIMTAAAKATALAKISTYAGDSSNPAPTLMDYTDAGVMGVNADNLEAVNAAVAAASTAADADTLADIQSLATPAIMTAAAKATALAKISTYAGDSSNPAPTLMDYTDAGVMGVSADNLEAVNAAVAAASTAADADTLADIQSLAAPAIMTAAAKATALAKISTYAGDSSNPAPTLMDYTDAGVMGVSADNLEAVNAAVAAASTAADADTLADIQSLAAPAIMTAAAKMAALDKISTYAGDSSSPAPTLMDYTDAGVMGVSADNLEAVNAAVAAASTAADADTLADIQALAAPAIMTAAAKATALAKISTYAGDSSSPAPTLMDYTDAGVMGVSADNLEAVNAAVAAASTAADADTLADIQSLAAPAIMTAAAKAAALAKISTYAGDDSNPAPTLMDYTDAGVMGVSADNLEAVNAAVAAASTAADADTLADIQSLAAPAIMTAAAKATALAKISTYAGDSSNPAPTLMDYTDAGVMGVSADNLEAVNAAVAAASTAADADTLADIQSLAAPAIMTAAANMAALDKISTYAGDSSSPAPTLMDYTDAGVMGVSADNLEAVNAAVAAASTAADADTLADIQSLAAPAIMTAAANMAALAKISTYAGDSSNPAPTLMDYTDAGVMGVSADNLEAVNAAVAAASTAAEADTLADIQSLAAPAIMTAAAKATALAKISTYAGDSSNPAPTLMDYTDAGVMGVSADNLEAVNMAVAAASTAADADTLADIQSLAAPAIMTAAANMAALSKISTYAGDSSNPAPTLMDYTDAGVMGVSADNLEAVNAAVAAASTAADADTLADIQSLAAPAIMTAAANMAALAKISTYAGDSSNPAPTLMDYTDAGVMGVSADNLEAVNAAVAAASTAADADTLADIQSLAAPAIAQSMADDDTGLSPESAKKLNEAILSLVQSMLASTMSAVNSRMDGAFSGRPEVASYQFDGQTVKLNGSGNLQDAMTNKLPHYAKSLKDGTMDWKAMLSRSSFVMPLNALDEDGGAGATVWGSGEYINLSDQDWKGDVFSLQLGVDQRMKDDLLAGGLVSWSKGDVDYTLDGERGKYTHRVTSIHPYMARSRDGVNLWGSVGYGQGELSIKPQGDNQSERSSGTRLLSLSAGVSGRLTQSGQSGLNLKSDMTLAQVDIAGSADDRIPADKLSSQRLRLLLEIDKERPLASGGRFKPVVEVGLRYDGGTGESGIGAVLGLGGRYANATGLTVEGKIHTLAGRKDYKEWGIQGTIRKTSANEQGLTFSLSPSYGATNNSANRAWERKLSDGNNRNDGYRVQLDVNMGYGLFTSGGLLTPYSELRMGDSNRYRLGLRWKPNSPFSLHLYGERNASSDSDRILLETNIRF